MKSKIIFSQPGCRRLILIFAGWSTVPSFYRHLHAQGWDIAIVWDYSNLDFNSSILEGYNTIFIIGWSLGVAAAAHAAATSLPPEKISAAFAVNGTLFPSSDDYGIPEDIYESTRANLNARNLLKFTKRMGYVATKLPKSSEESPEEKPEDIYIPDFGKLALELENMRSKIQRGALPWKKVFISRNDRIFPYGNLKNFWESQEVSPAIISLDAPHYVDLQKIINDITPDLDRIGHRFEEAIPTYEENAEAQNRIVERLVTLLPEDATLKAVNLLEIGTGSGILARRLAKLVNPQKATFLDLFPLNKLGVYKSEEYVCEDAEKWILSAPDNEFDIIASANTIQWFADPESFLKEAARTLSQDGILLCSTFIKGNLRELDSLRPSPLLYRDKEELTTMLQRYFRDVTVMTEEIVLNFSSRRELLIHLKLTGVAGGSKGDLPVIHEPDEHRLPDSGRYSLTYVPLYILARK